ncbi:malto-oligosyltrehalose trehalohydrolase [Streptomyces boncukensis]|uniref:Malto-oligosyltrehalose trehalohydrolase n=1 Tax=Streptomyces boncukensis TaxID=2711219 RepID=A0A6G4WUP5_9ACTN|nr:malto-oligosyltrehalose trehalohydrolase [Streptomyces boncukensis]NGO68264.1 malto-oligosyltrehalose trehalohydrolase [Streptomyces boncukensis]
MLFEVWAPDAARVTLHLFPDTARAMAPSRVHRGWWQAEAPARDGAHYGFSVDGGPVRPDPRSRRQPDGPGGPSAVVDHDTFRWRHPWRGLPLPGAVLYELHTGTFTAEGTFEAAAARLPHLAALGVTHVELLPVCPFPGTHGWGYDGVAPWAVHEPYGGPEGLKRFVDAAHGHGLGVVLDVVHNHFGPSGNHLAEFGPYLTDRYRTPWGKAVNLDGPGSDEVRAYLIGSALAFLRDYQADGLRLDAVHTLADSRAEHFLAELSDAVDTLGAHTGRPLFLIAESDLNDPRTTAPRTAHGHGVHAQWNDDFHHALHTLLTGESHGYYADFAHAPCTALAKTVTDAFFHDGRYSSFRGRRHGRPVRPGATAVPAHRFLAYAQTHDQVGNRTRGDRLSALVPPGLLACAAALVLLAPGTPLLFMGEEWGARTPWRYFTDHTEPGPAEAVGRGRRRESAAHGRSQDQVPDPQDPAARESSCLDWSEPERAPHARLLEWYRSLTALRHAHPILAHAPLGQAHLDHQGTAGGAPWVLLRNGPLLVAANLSAGRTAEIPLPSAHSALLAAWSPEETGVGGAGVLRLPPESAAVLRRQAREDG